jgi:hypothetical protein
MTMDEYRRIGAEGQVCASANHITKVAPVDTWQSVFVGDASPTMPYFLV